MKKRGLSSAVTTILLVLLVIVAVIIVWTIINTVLIKEGVREISLRRMTVSIAMPYAAINYTTGIATVRIKRNIGEGNLTGVKILIGDDKTTEVFTRYFNNFDEGEERTITIDLTKEAMELVLTKISKITIAPIIVLESGKEVLGPEIEGKENLNEGIIGLNESLEEETGDEGGGECTLDDLSSCEPEGWIEGTEICSNDNRQVLQYYKKVSCVVGFCVYNNEQRIKKVCLTSETCINAQCIENLQECTLASECGISGFVGNTKCINSSTVGRDYQLWECINGFCDDSIQTYPTEYCLEGEICEAPAGIADCFVPLECATNSDCDIGEICEEGSCVLEEYLSAGRINTAWPFYVGEYFDSADLPTEIENYKGYYVIFPGSAETRCLQILEHVYPEKVGAYAYVKLSVTETTLSNGDAFQVWKTDNGCLYV